MAGSHLTLYILQYESWGFKWPQSSREHRAGSLTTQGMVLGRASYRLWPGVRAGRAGKEHPFIAILDSPHALLALQGQTETFADPHAAVATGRRVLGPAH